MDEETGLYYYGARSQDPRTSVFISVDRYAEKYAGLTPYQYAANNPINYIDVNGDSILIRNGKERIIYNRGNLTWAGTNRAYDGKSLRKDGTLKGFLGKTTKALEDIRSSGPTGALLVGDIEDDMRYVTIKSGTGNSNRGLTVQFDPSSRNGGPDESLSTKRPSWLGLAHELAHSYDYLVNGMSNQGDLWFTTSNNRTAA